MAKISNFRQIFGFLPPQNRILPPRCPPQKKKFLAPPLQPSYTHTGHTFHSTSLFAVSWAEGFLCRPIIPLFTSLFSVNVNLTKKISHKCLREIFRSKSIFIFVIMIGLAWKLLNMLVKLSAYQCFLCLVFQSPVPTQQWKHCMCNNFFCWGGEWEEG